MYLKKSNICNYEEFLNAFMSELWYHGHGQITDTRPSMLLVIDEAKTVN